MASRLSDLFVTILIQFCLVVPSTAYPRDFHDYKLVSRALEDTNAKNLEEHAEKYAIPYGVLGVVSHALTFYVILCHLFGRSPLFPLRYLKKERWNVAVVSLSSLITIILSGVTLARTRGSRPLMIMAGMQMVLSALIDFIHVHRMMLKAEGWNRPLAFWTIPLLVVSIFSVYALYEFNFTHEEGKSRNIFESIGVLVILAWVGLTGLATAISFIACALTGFREMLSFAVSATVLSCALFWLGDVGLAMVTKNSIGTPSPQVEALYYTFWVVERLPMFTF